ncbi:hypothetical protein SAMN05421870_101436 [Streptomyces qinglanensis]|uniref:Uncharacterized protein n=1 Tax=Streptomyces qinglanensis TaxID=943816 RepID=A0A1H9NJ39_9ACTN|nr:hypothetical protein SAMN05421870_101436 [Streptomyces qinglanensis]
MSAAPPARKPARAADSWWGESAALAMAAPGRGRPVSAVGGRRGPVAQLNESPQAQEPVAFGLSIVKPCFSMVSTKSMEAPPR